MKQLVAVLRVGSDRVLDFWRRKLRCDSFEVFSTTVAELAPDSRRVFASYTGRCDHKTVVTFDGYAPMVGVDHGHAKRPFLINDK